ncbi:outer membrane cobalamin receptor protein [Nostoc sp. PCC 7524]|uniref:TonB-dependent receptor plug domain-containing protein n=1 Tax=Nostoc sp. (strain ATCC 29411 / PCC 7524) TaxID=28072 RepID=UPI00029ED121|nr:TonB-dependent receptor [Nostoc sp. PCC 7524]AFY50490.1 outer membrane cobalamin receptor protein [Nostoc sp. PCC 7524]
MKQNLYLLPLSLLSTFIASPSLALEIKIGSQDIKQNPHKINAKILHLSEIPLHSTEAQLLTQALEKNDNEEVIETEELESDNTSLEEDTDIDLEVIGTQDKLPQSTPTYIIDQAEIQKQGSTSVADVLKRMPGFAINDVGHGADIHTGTYYRGHSINQSVFLINGRPINNDVSTYHGATDLNSIPVESIERVELYSGAATALYGSSAFGGIVNIITKQGSTTPRFNAAAEFGSLNLNNQQTSFSGGSGNFRYNLSFERFFIDNRYKVPQGAANRDTSGNLFNADTATSTYFGNFAIDLNPQNTLSLDVKKLSSRRGLIYFGFPLQRDRLDHDGLNIGLSWRSQLAQGSNLTTTLGYNQDFFNTYGPTVFQGNTFYRTGTLDTQNLTARVDHDWQITGNNRLRWGLDLKNTNLDGITDSTSPNRIAFNEVENRSVLNTALFAVNTWNISDRFLVDLGLRQSFDSQFGNYLNPSVGLRYAMSPNLAVRGSWASGQRNPGLDQLYLYDTVHGWLSNPDLKPETGSSWTGGVDVNFSQNLTGQFTYFGSSLDNRLGIIQGQWQNIGLVDTNGFEAALRWRLASNWSTFFNYTYTDAQIKTGTERGLQLGLIPYSNLQAGIGYEKDGWQANLYATYNSGARRALFLNPSDRNTDFSPSYVNFDLSGRIPLNRGLGLTFYLENLLGEQYERVNRIYSPGFTFRVGLSSGI